MSASSVKGGENNVGGRLASGGHGTDAVTNMANINAAADANGAVDALPSATTPVTVGMAASDTTERTVGVAASDAIGTPGQPAAAVQVWNDSLLQGVMQVKMLGGKGIRGDPDKLKKRTPWVLAFLFHLEHEVGASPRLKVVDVPRVFSFIKQNPDKWPEEVARKAAQLYDRFEEENWGEDEIGDDASGDDTPAPAPSSNPTSSSGTIRARLPPPNHPIWGLGGIMHGIALKAQGARSYILDPRFISEKRSAKAIGHNNLTPGDWWPLQRVALFHGAHGHPVSGISGSAEYGAYSIVVSGRSSLYHEMDRDEGETLYYSADNSADNTNPIRVDHVTNRTKSLMTSLRTRSPVRVLRSAATGTGRNDRPFAPSIGIRYDGLYTVVDRREELNQRGGKFWQFKLVRRNDQRPWRETTQASPTARQIHDFGRIEYGY